MAKLRFADFAPVRRFQPALALSPDGASVVYASNASGQSNLWRQDIGSETATQLTRFTERAVRDVAWSPDGSKLLFTADHHGDEFHQVFVMDAHGGEPHALTDAPSVQHQLAVVDSFSPDGRYVAFAGNDREPTCQDVVLYDLQTGETRRVLTVDGLNYAVAFSPDGRKLSAVRLNSNTDSDLMLVDVDAPAPASPVMLSPHDGEAKNELGPWHPDGSAIFALSDQGREFTGIAQFAVEPGEPQWYEKPEWDVEQLALSADGRVLAWTVNEDGYSRLHVRNLETCDDLALPELPAGMVTTLRVSRAGRRLAYLLAKATRPTEVVAVDLVTGSVEVLTDSTPSALLEVEPVEPELVRFPTHDGREVPAFLYRPAAAHGPGPLPVVLSIHGGPEAQERPMYMYGGFYQYLLANGIGILAPNVRGSTGYGASYQKLIHHDWGGAELGDFEHAVRYLRGVEWVDPTRIAVFGASFGGFATLSCVSRLPDLWAAAVDIVGPSNLVSFVQAVPPTWRRLMAAWVGDHETEREFLLTRSPVTYADAIRTPLFVIQGANDPRVVKAESDQIVHRLRARGVDVRYDVYDDEGHGFTKRANEIKALGDAGEFLIEHLSDA